MNYFKDGYHIEHGMISPMQIDQMLNSLHKLVQLQIPQRDLTLLPSMKTLLEQDKDLYLHTLRTASQLTCLQNILTYKRIKRLCAKLRIKLSLFQTSPVLHVMSSDLEVPGGYFGIGAHQDYSSTEASKNGIIVWIPFIDTENNYALEVVPGSHACGPLPGIQKEHYLEVPGLDGKFIRLNLKAGDVLFMSVLTVHRTCLEGNFRVAGSIRYEDALEKSFVERGYPCKYKRVYQP